MPENDDQSRSNSDAEFIGWQRSTNGAEFALFNVTAPGHPLFHSTVSEKTLRQQQLEIPPVPADKDK